jgi:hypothetical protein
MSTLTDHLGATNTPIERRFYSRVAPQTPTQIAFGSNFQNTVLNVSENGLLVSATPALQLNSVQRVSLTLNGIPKSISVYVRTVWSENSQGLAGIQLLDLAEDDRELIRRWSALQSPQQVENPAQTFPSQWVAPSSQPSQSLVMLPGITATPANTPVTIPAPTPENHGSCAAEPSEEELAFAGADPAPQPPLRPAASPLIFWIAALSVICLAAVGALAYNLYDNLLAQPARSQAARASSLHHRQPPVAVHTSANPTSALNPSPQEDASDLLLAETATKEKSEPDAPTYHSNVNAPPELPSRTEPPSASITHLRHSSPSVNKHLQASPLSARDSAVADSTPAAAQSTAVAAVRAAAPPNIQTAAVNPAPGNTSASNSIPRTLSVDAVPSPSPSFSQSPSANSNAISNSTLSSTPNSNSHPASNSLAASKSPRLAIASTPTSNSKSTPPSLAFPSSSPPHSAETSSTIPRNSNSATTNLDVPQTHPGPRIVELSPYSYNTFVNLPGERVIQSPAMTMHIQRSVWVRGGRWFWRGRKKVVLGQLSSRLDPQIPRTARYGTITVRATIDKEGRITRVRPLYGSSAFLLNVSKAIHEWRYEPTYVDNKPVETQAKIEVDFHSLSDQASRP